ncbi:hypothetical protein SAMN05421505_101336 [Sinosporangium album]|uniref:Uncharacterized protein n=1 Tax=Sinosporangium album TaxID=504805 RepID=A0A1G7RB36_9ACTN|nr:hypothetical protein [Sinosporangium album]SDG08021.1 hypothetical protein SAMN05421505_101336 [Sinosporangium album]
MTTQAHEMPPALAAMMTDDEVAAVKADAARWRYGFLVVCAGLIVVLLGFVVVVFKSGAPETAFAGLVGVVGTTIGAYFGVQVGQSGKDRVEAELRRTTETAMRLAAKIHSHDADEVIKATMDRGRGTK